MNSKCHHQITQSKLNLYIEYPPPYERSVWDYKKAHIDNIKNTIESVNLEFLLNNKTANRQVAIFNETNKHFFFNFVPKKLATFNGHVPPWMNDFVNNNIKWKRHIYKTYKIWSHIQ